MQFQHVGLAVDLMMHFRPPNADWVMINPFFSAQILKENGLPLYYADGVTNGIPWFREGIEKVCILKLKLTLFIIYYGS